MTLLRERGRSDDNDARAFLLSNTAEERVELLWDRRGFDLISDAVIHCWGRWWRRLGFGTLSYQRIRMTMCLFTPPLAT